MKKQSAGREPLYEESDKIAIAREYLTGNLGYSELGKKYGLGKATIRHFVKWYEQNYGGIEASRLTPEEAGAVPAGPDADKPAATTAREKEKDKALEEAQLKIMALEMLIANASKEVGFDLLKKYGTKQSNK